MNVKNNNIEETLITPPLAKVLECTGFRGKINKKWRLKEEKEEYELIELNHPKFYYEGSIIAPTQQLVVDWLRINFNFHIQVYFATHKNQWYFNIMDITESPGKEYLYRSGYSFKTYEQAKEEAILYCLIYVNFTKWKT